MNTQVSVTADDAANSWMTHDIFEGTDQIQQLIIARSLSGLRIE